MKLAVYYLALSLAFFVLHAVAPETAQGLVVAFIGLLLVPALYAEWLRIKGGH